jgi:hypothetical protein
VDHKGLQRARQRKLPGLLFMRKRRLVAGFANSAGGVTTVLPAYASGDRRDSEKPELDRKSGPNGGKARVELILEKSYCGADTVLGAIKVTALTLLQ